MEEISVAYNYPITLISFFIAVIACFTSIELLGRVLSNVRNKVRWVLASSITMGTGTWTMHFTGMLAFEPSVPIVYDGIYTTLSLIIPILTSFFAFYLTTVTFKQLNYKSLFLSATILGLGLSSMHYIGMRGMKIEAYIEHNYILVMFSILIALIASFVLLVVIFKVRTQFLYIYHFPVSVLMGVSISCMHYVGMESMTLFENEESGFHGHSSIWEIHVNSDFMLISSVIVTITMIVIMYTISIRNKSIQSKIHHMAYHDPLTGLPNRYMLNEYFHKALARYNRNNKEFAVIFLDLDNFKFINDTMGHDVGDYVLKQVAVRLLKSVRDGDVVTRRGGDEFLILLDGIDESQVKEVAERILSSFTVPFILGEKECFTSSSIGISIAPIDGQDLETLTKCADKAMYLAKKQGKNNYQFHTNW
ncbi:sensor domain-containing diguanylate cyclase [Aquibacillus saliphilus]|uniref:sensor domain-containing diguanylate cyclase n=1 Tax=Aquibacillus saliphilus TaxID=1909422 RepID=UPI001CEFF42A|nr:diguanylate cyclase [Aquibacillus saliphilus]